jgi:hypothetical protein
MQLKLLETLDENSTRAQALMSIVDFRKKWVVAGEWLCTIAYGGDYKDWGYSDFEAYCANELGIKKNTAKKLMTSYQYLKAKHNKMLTEESNAIPEYQTIALLNKAHGIADTENQLVEVEAKIFSGELAEDDARREIKAIIAEPVLPGMDEENAFQKLIIMARKFTRELRACKKVPEGLSDRLNIAINELEKLK